MPSKKALKFPRMRGFSYQMGFAEPVIRRAPYTPKKWGDIKYRLLALMEN